MIKPPDDCFGNDSLQLRDGDGSAHGDFQLVIMPMPVGVIAFAEQLGIGRGIQLGIMEPMRRGKLESMTESNHRMLRCSHRIGSIRRNSQAHTRQIRPNRAELLKQPPGRLRSAAKLQQDRQSVAADDRVNPL